MTNYDQIFKERENQLSKLIQNVTSQNPQLPTQKTPPNLILSLLNLLSYSDSNNSSKSCIGEREGRIYSEIIKQAHYGLAHGVGRSGNITDLQPKAVGSNYINLAANRFVRQIIRDSGFKSCKSCQILPFCTGMTMNFVLQCLNIKKALWLRMDQKSIPKALILASCAVTVVEPTFDENRHQLIFDISNLDLLVQQNDCVITTASCFAPREPDNLPAIGQLCRKYKKIHLVNNAYGINSDRVMTTLDCCDDVDFVISSLDKNFLVPVGSSVVYCKTAQRVENEICKKYAGRAENTGFVDLFITLLELGRDGFKQLQKQRKAMFALLEKMLRTIKEITVVTIQNNEISLCFFFESISLQAQTDDIAAHLFRRGISGAKALVKGGSFKIGDYELVDFGRGGVYNAPPYITCAAAIGVTLDDINIFIEILRDEIQLALKRIDKENSEMPNQKQ